MCDDVYIQIAFADTYRTGTQAVGRRGEPGTDCAEKGLREGRAVECMRALDRAAMIKAESGAAMAMGGGGTGGAHMAPPRLTVLRALLVGAFPGRGGCVDAWA